MHDRSWIGIGSRIIGRPVHVVRLGCVGVVELVRAHALTGYRREAEFVGRSRTGKLCGARTTIRYASRFGLSEFAVGCGFLGIAPDDLSGLQIDRRSDVSCAVSIGGRSSGHGPTFGHSLKVLLATLAVLNVRQHPGVIVGIELPVQELQQDAVVGTCIHDGIPRMAAPARPGVASMVFTQDTLFVNKHYMISPNSRFFPTC